MWYVPPFRHSPPCLADLRTIGAIAALIGEGAITHATDAQRMPAKVTDEVYARDRIETGERSVIRVLMGGRITVTIRERSIVSITAPGSNIGTNVDTAEIAGTTSTPPNDAAWNIGVWWR